MDRLTTILRGVMNPGFIPTWLTTPNEAMGHRSPMAVLEDGEVDRFWRVVFTLGSGLPV